MSQDSSTICPRCGHAASGNFCTTCGAGLAGAHCSSCGAALSAGAAFCHSCGKATSGAPQPLVRMPAPTAQNSYAWIIAGLLIIAVIAGVVYSARSHSAPTPANMPNAGNAGLAQTITAPPIDNLTPKEQFTRLNRRVIAAAGKGDTATVLNFWPMTVGAYQLLPATDRDVDTRYDMAMLYLMVAQFPQTLALADTILAVSPDNLMGYYLRGLTAEYQGDSTAARAARTQFVKHYPNEIKKQQTEYVNNRSLLDQFFHKGGGK